MIGSAIVFYSLSEVLVIVQMTQTCTVHVCVCAFLFCYAHSKHKDASVAQQAFLLMYTACASVALRRQQRVHRQTLTCWLNTPSTERALTHSALEPNRGSGALRGAESPPPGPPRLVRTTESSWDAPHWFPASLFSDPGSQRHLKNMTDVFFLFLQKTNLSMFLERIQGVKFVCKPDKWLIFTFLDGFEREKNYISFHISTI